MSRECSFEQLQMASNAAAACPIEKRKAFVYIALLLGIQAEIHLTHMSVVVLISSL